MAFISCRGTAANERQHFGKSDLGHSRRFDGVLIASGLPPINGHLQNRSACLKRTPTAIMARIPSWKRRSQRRAPVSARAVVRREAAGEAPTMTVRPMGEENRAELQSPCLIHGIPPMADIRRHRGGHRRAGTSGPNQYGPDPWQTSPGKVRHSSDSARFVRTTRLQPQGRPAGLSPADGTPPRPAECRPVSRRVRAGSPGRPSSRARRR